MADSSRRTPLPAAYRRKLLDQPGSSTPTERSASELFFHLGYWSDPAGAGRKLADLQAAQQRLNDRLTAMADLHDGLRVLDVGCGIGGTIDDIGRTHALMDLVGVNIDADQLRRARTNAIAAPDNAHHWIHADGCSLPFAAGSVDRVTAVECIFHFASRRDFFSEAARVLHPGGRLVLSDFVVTDKLRALRVGDPETARMVENAIVPSVGPWPDFWGDDSDDVAIASDVGLALVATENASIATQPSYRCFVEHDPIEHPADANGDANSDGKSDAKTGTKSSATTSDPVERAMSVMEWLQANGHIEMQFYAFERRPPV